MSKVRELLLKGEKAPALDWKSGAIKELILDFEERFGRDFIRLTTRYSSNPKLIEWFKSESDAKNPSINHIDWGQYPTTQLFFDYLEINAKRGGTSFDLVQIIYIPGYPHALLLETKEDYAPGYGVFVDSKERFEEAMYNIIERNFSLIVAFSRGE